MFRVTKYWRHGEAVRPIRILTMLLAATIVHNFDLSAHAQQQVRSLSADLTFNFDCKGIRSPELDEGLERFLKETGFSVLNLPRQRRERGMPPAPQNFGMEAVDQGQRMIFIRSSNMITPDSYALHLYSPPPTRRARNLEEQILTFISDDLRCRVREIVRKEGGPETRDFYKEFLERTKTRIRELNGEI